MKFNNGEKFYTSSEIVNLVGISLRQLYYWELKGVIQPKAFTLGSREFKHYSENDIVTLKKIKQFLSEGYNLNKAIEKVRNK